jgi:hypothetical protein
MAYSKLEQQIIDNYLTVQYPEPEPEPAEEMPFEPFQVAQAGPARIDLRGMAVPDKQTGATPRINARTGRPITGPSMSDITEPAMGMLNMGAATVKGAVQGFAGLPGDVEALSYGIKELFNRGAGEGKIDAFLRGMSEQTIMPRTDEIRKWLDTNVGTVAGGENPYETIGEVVAPAGQIKAAKAAVKGVAKGAKALAPKAGEMAEDYLRRTGQMANVVPPGPSAAPARAAAPVSDMGFYSAVEQAALNTQRKSGPGQAFLNDILKGENVKADEVKWIGLDEFLKGKKNVTREEVQQFISANKVDLQEVQLGESGGAEARFIASQDIGETLQAGGVLDDDAQFALKAWRESAPGSRMESQNAVLLEEKLREAGDNRTVAEFLDAGSAQTDNTRYGTYTLPGGENYREILLTLPSDTPKAERGSAYYRETSRDFRSTHWNQPNVLAHLRVNDRVDADGKKMLLIEEVQSDWHQAGRDKGYIPKDISAVELKATVNNSADRPYYEVRTASGQFVANIVDVPVEAGNEARAVTEAQRFLRNRGIPGAVPDAPMKDTWYQLALKRALKYAADNGYERVGLTTGKRQVERYPEAMRQIADEIVWDSYVGGGKAITVKKNGGNVFGAEIDKNGVIVRSNVSQAVGKPLNEVIGKSMADKAINAPSGEIKGTDFTVGGEGMKKYYDEVYPQFLAKYGKKWDAKVGQTTVQADGAEPVRYIDITPQMRESVGKGQPLFTAVPAGTAAGAATMQDKEQK